MSEGGAERVAERGVEWIMSVIPHRYPFLLVDRVLEIEPRRRIVAVKSVSVNEEFFTGHFPGHPVMPGVLLVEGMAQTGAILLLWDLPDRERKLVYFTSIEKAKFRRPVVPGDQLRYEVEMQQLRDRYCRLKGRTFVGDRLVAEGICASAIVER